MEPESESLRDVIRRYVEVESAPAVKNSEVKAPEVGTLRRALLVPETRAVNEAKREIIFTSSDESVDRFGDVIRVGGWDFRDYLRNPVFLWSHKSAEPPIGKTVKIGIEANPPALVQTVEFADAKISPFADQIFRLYKGGFLNAVSVGFRPTKPPTPRNDENGNFQGWTFDGQSLLELSAVPIPANQNALAKALGEGIITPETRALLEPPPATTGATLARRILAAVAAKTGKTAGEFSDAEAIERAEFAFELMCADATLSEMQLSLLKKFPHVFAKAETEQGLAQFLAQLDSKPVSTMADLERALRGGAS